jgi:hypothetical protein
MAAHDTCPCGNPRTEHHGALVCTAHCDVGGPAHPASCGWCRAYSAAVNLRVINEHLDERKRGTQ